MFIHYTSRCHDRLYLDVSSGFKMLAEFSVSVNNQHLQVTKIQMFPGNSVSDVKFVCASCGQVDDLSTVRVVCNRCHEIYPVSEISLPKESGGFFCKDCVKVFTDESTVKLSTLITKPIVIKERS